MKNLKNEDVLYYFMRGTDAMNSGKNLQSVGGRLLNYGTEIARCCGRVTLVNGKKFSSTTSKHQNYLMKNDYTLVVTSDIYDYINSSDEGYEVVNETYNKFVNEHGTEGCVNITGTRKKDKLLHDMVTAYLYEERK